jgi:hypothetical protein
MGCRGLLARLGSVRGLGSRWCGARRGSPAGPPQRAGLEIQRRARHSTPPGEEARAKLRRPSSSGRAGTSDSERRTRKMDSDRLGVSGPGSTPDLPNNGFDGGSNEALATGCAGSRVEQGLRVCDGSGLRGSRLAKTNHFKRVNQVRGSVPLRPAALLPPAARGAETGPPGSRAALALNLAGSRLRAARTRRRPCICSPHRHRLVYNSSRPKFR